MSVKLTVILFAACIPLSAAAEEKVSDACHGLSNVIKSYNNLTCGPGLTVYVTAVRYYQWKHIQICPHELSNEQVRPSCCLHEKTTCSWTNLTQKKQFKERCMGKMMCRIHSRNSQPVADPCINATIYPFSSVRSIRYQCVKNGSIDNAAVFSTQQTKDNSTLPGYSLSSTTQTVGDDLESNNNQKDVGITIGSVNGALVVSVFTILAVVFFIRRAKSKGNEPDILSANTQSTETKKKQTRQYMRALMRLRLHPS